MLLSRTLRLLAFRFSAEFDASRAQVRLERFGLFEFCVCVDFLRGAVFRHELSKGTRERRRFFVPQRTGERVPREGVDRQQHVVEFAGGVIGVIYEVHKPPLVGSRRDGFPGVQWVLLE